MFPLLVGIVLSFCELSNSVQANVSSDDDPCIAYKELQDSTRSQFNRLLGGQQPKCDNKLVLGWYRFTGGAGIKMPESCITSGRCGTHSPGWYDGPMPVKVGGNSSGRVCFNWIDSCCVWSSPATVKRCNGFYVYKLTPTSHCDLLYCGDGAVESTEAPTTTLPSPLNTTTKPELTEEPATTLPSLMNTTTKPADDYSMDVKCDKDQIKVMLHIKSNLNYDPETVQLNDASCKPSFQNSSHIFIKSTLEGCGMEWNVSRDGKMLIYRNAITALVKGRGSLGLHVSRDHLAVFEFQCRYQKTVVLSVVSFNSSERFVISDIKSFGNFTFEMSLFKSGDFREHYTEYPIGPIDVGTDIFLQVTVRSNDTGVIVFVDECKATATPNYDDEMQFVFLEDGCPKDSNLRYNYTLSSVQRFVLAAFNFRSVNSKEIFLHCLVLACLHSDESSRCAKGCPFEKRKRRVIEENVEQHLAVGPIIVSSPKPKEPSASSSPKDDTIIIAVGVGVLGFAAVLLVAAVVIILCKPHRTPKVTGATTSPLL